nr:hypothetical protein [Tanacetum cinerariifolium]
MSTPVYVDSKTITQADGAQSSRVPTPLPNDPYVAVREAQLVDIDTESEPEEAPSEADESHPLGSRVPLMGEEFEAFEPSGTRTISSHSSASSDSTAPLSPDHPLTHASPTPTATRVSFHRRTARMVVHADREGHGLDDEGHGLDDEVHGLNDEGHCLEDEGPGSEKEEEAELEGQQQEVLIVDISVSEPLGLGYRALRPHESALGEGLVPSTFEIRQSSSFTIIPVFPSPITLLVTTPATTISADEDSLLEVGAQLELHRSILHDHTQRLDALPPTLFEGYDRDLRESYTRSREHAVMQRELQEMRGRVAILEQERGRKV